MRLAVVATIAVPSAPIVTKRPVVMVPVAMMYCHSESSLPCTIVFNANNAVVLEPVREAPKTLEVTKAICFSLRDQNTRELGSGTRHVARPADELHHRVLIDALALATDGNEIAILVRTPEDVVGIERPGMVGSRTRSRLGRTHRTRDPASQHHIGRHPATVELQFRTKPRSSCARACRTRDELNRLE